MKNILTVIPARFASTRFPGKPLVEIKGEPMIWQVYMRAIEAGLEHIYVATDDMRILDAVASRGGKAIMTASSHLSGTDRCGEVLRTLNKNNLNFDFLINLQGDEPFIQPQQLRLLADGLEKGKVTTLVKKIEKEEQLQNYNIVKAVWSKKTSEALYFSRFPIPYLRSAEAPLTKHDFYKHIGLYGFDASLLLQLVKLQPSSLEMAESLEQLRWLENGFKIKILETSFETVGIDNPEDIFNLTI